MNRLPFLLPDFTRTVWASAEAQMVWEHRLRQIDQAWAKVEQWAVVDGVRDSCLCVVSPEKMVEMSTWAAEHRLVVLTLGRVKQDGTYNTNYVEPGPGDAWQYRVVITRPELIKNWHEVWGEGQKVNHDHIGFLLDYPECCTENFIKRWVKGGCRDLTWLQAENTMSGGHFTDIKELQVHPMHPEVNTLWRWLGVRQVSHLPCSFNCEASIEQAQNLVSVAEQHGFKQVMDWADQILAWPVEWTALHGVAEIKTPILKIITRTDATAEKHTVQWMGTSYPDEGVTGLGFPFREPVKREIKIPVKDPPDEALVELATGTNLAEVARLNGFSTYKGMTEAHDVILRTVATVPAPPPNMDSVLADPGCGDGRLLQEIQKLSPNYWPLGIEMNREAAQAAKLRLYPPHSRATVMKGNIFEDWVWRQAMGPFMPSGGSIWLMVLMPGRLLEEQDARKVERFKRMLREHVQNLVVYAYADNLKPFDGSLWKLCHAAGLVEEGQALVQHGTFLTPNTAAGLVWKQEASDAV